MSESLVQWSMDSSLASIRLNRPEQRNALNLAMFDGLDAALKSVAQNDRIVAVLLAGAGPAFCAGFDLKPVLDKPDLMARYIERLSRTIRLLRRLDAVVVAAVQGSAIAGGCALLTGCDFVFVDADAKLGYPVHQIGITPAVTIPTLVQAIDGGHARSLLMSGQIIDGRRAVEIGLASHVVGTGKSVAQDAGAFAKGLCDKGPIALRTTKRWLNELDGSLDDRPGDAVVKETTELCQGDEAKGMLRAYWESRSK